MGNWRSMAIPHIQSLLVQTLRNHSTAICCIQLLKGWRKIIPWHHDSDSLGQHSVLETTTVQARSLVPRLLFARGGEKSGERNSPFWLAEYSIMVLFAGMLVEQSDCFSKVT